jgi:hypothetical protein
MLITYLLVGLVGADLFLFNCSIYAKIRSTTTEITLQKSSSTSDSFMLAHQELRVENLESKPA